MHNLRQGGRRAFLAKTIGGLVLTSFVPMALAKDDEIAQLQVTLIDYAATQRMLVQRATKLYAQYLVMRSAMLSRVMPALFTKMVTTPNRASIWARAASHAAASVTFRQSPCPLKPASASAAL